MARSFLLCFSSSWFRLTSRYVLTNWVEVLIDWMALPSLALLAGILLYRKWQREFPFFLAYIVATDAIGIARLLASQIGGKVYYYVYWGSDIVVVVFAFLATYELFIKRLFPSFYKTGFYRYLFPAATVLITLVAVSTALYGGKLTILVVGVRVYEFLRAAILLFFLALMVFMGRRGRNRNSALPLVLDSMFLPRSLRWRSDRQLQAGNAVLNRLSR